MQCSNGEKGCYFKKKKNKKEKYALDFRYANNLKLRTQLFQFKVNTINRQNILDFMHFMLMWFLMSNLPSPFSLKSLGKSRHI